MGHDHWLTWIDVASLAITSSADTEGIFYTFLPVDLEDEVVAIDELGAQRLHADGSVKWSVSAGDIVSGWRMDKRENLVLTRFEDNSQMIVSLATGKPSQ